MKHALIALILSASNPAWASQQPPQPPSSGSLRSPRFGGGGLAAFAGGYLAKEAIHSYVDRDPARLDTALKSLKEPGFWVSGIGFGAVAVVTERMAGVRGAGARSITQAIPLAVSMAAFQVLSDHPSSRDTLRTAGAYAASGLTVNFVSNAIVPRLPWGTRLLWKTLQVAAGMYAGDRVNEWLIARSTPVAPPMPPTPVARPALPANQADQTMQKDLLKKIQPFITDMRIAGHWPEGMRFVGRDGALAIPPKTAFTIRLDAEGVIIDVDPTTLLELPWKPDMRVKSVRYDFASGTFDAQAVVDWGDISDTFSRFGRSRLNDYMNNVIRPYLPERMRVAGYKPAEDPDLLATLQDLASMGERHAGPGETSSAAGPAAGGSAAPSRVSGLTILSRLAFTRETVIPIKGYPVEMVIPKGAALRIDARTSASSGGKNLEWFHADAKNAGVKVRPMMIGGTPALFDAVKVNGATWTDEKGFSLDYDVDPRKAVGGIRDILEVFGRTAGMKLP